RKVLGSGVQLAIFRVVTLQTFHKFDAHKRGEKWIFTIGFLTSTPARVAKNIDIGRPKCQPLIALTQAPESKFMVLCARFITDDCRYFAHQFFIETGSKPDGLRKNSCGARARDTVQRLVPPFVSWDIQTRDSWSIVHHL